MRDASAEGDVIVTTMHAAAARRSHPRGALAVLTALVGIGLAGCETSSSLFSGSLFGGSGSAPAPEVSAAPPAQPLPPLAKISVSPIIGAPDAIAKQIQQEFTSTVEKQRVTVVGKDERADYTLRGYVVAAKVKSTTKVSYIWDVTDPTGKRVNRITGEEVVSGNTSKDPWAALTPQVAQTIAGKAASSFMTWLPSHLSQGAVASGTSQPASAAVQPAGGEPKRMAAAKAPPPPQPGTTTGSIPDSAANGSGVSAVVPAVTGAPGDGRTSLTAAIQRELQGKGIAIAEKATPTTYRVEGSVTLGAAKDGKQPIQIEWLVRDPKGKKLGTVSQKNEIPQGSLDGAWDKTAEQAASAAAQGIVKLLPKTTAVN